VPNRGVATQPDLGLFGLHYLQRVSDADLPPFSTAGQALHIEPGLFMNVPASVVPSNPASIVRLASIPHGVGLLMQGPNPGSTPTDGAPVIPPIYPIPALPTFTPAAGSLGLGIQPVDIPPPGSDGLEHIVPEVNIAADIAGSQSNGPYPASFQGFINDPNSVLREAIAGQEILGFIKIDLSTEGVGSGIENIPFLGIANPAQAVNPTTPNAFVSSATATFWIEWVKIPNAHPLVGATAASALAAVGGVAGSVVGAAAAAVGAAAAAVGVPDPLRAIEPFWDQPTFLQLQYSQMVILIFNGVLWPHVTVATLTLSAG